VTWRDIFVALVPWVLGSLVGYQIGFAHGEARGWRKERAQWERDTKERP